MLAPVGLTHPREGLGDSSKTLTVILRGETFRTRTVTAFESPERSIADKSSFRSDLQGQATSEEQVRHVLVSYLTSIDENI